MRCSLYEMICRNPMDVQRSAKKQKDENGDGAAYGRSRRRPTGEAHLAGKLIIAENRAGNPEKPKRGCIVLLVAKAVFQKFKVSDFLKLPAMQWQSTRDKVRTPSNASKRVIELSQKSWNGTRLQHPHPILPDGVFQLAERGYRIRQLP